MPHSSQRPPAAVNYADTGGHRPTDGSAWSTFRKEHHQWKNESQAPVNRVTYNPVASEAAEH